VLVAQGQTVRFGPLGGLAGSVWRRWRLGRWGNRRVYDE
jgi:hypothetical protein